MSEAIQVSQEDEAMQLSKLFQRAAEAIVAASTLPKEVEGLRQQVTALQNELDAAKLHSAELDKTLAEIREQRNTFAQERDEARIELDHTRVLLSEAKEQKEAAHRQIEAAHRQIESLGADIVRLEGALSEERAKSAASAEAHDRMSDAYHIVCEAKAILEKDVATLRHERDVARLERDNLGFHSMELEDKLSEIKQRMKAVFGLQEAPEQVAA